MLFHPAPADAQVRCQRDFPQEDHFVVSGSLLESLLQKFFRLLLIPGEIAFEGSHDSRRRLAEPFPRRIIADPEQNGPYRVLDLFLRDGRRLAGNRYYL